MRLVGLAVILGAILGVIGSKILFVGSFLTLLPWSVAGLIVGFFSRNRRNAIFNGAIYGFVLSFVFMATGYTGDAPLITRFPFFILLGIFGALCGAVLGVLGNRANMKIS